MTNNYKSGQLPDKQRELDYKTLAYMGASFAQTPKRVLTFLTYVYEHADIYDKQTNQFFSSGDSRYTVIHKDAYIYLPLWSFADVKDNVNDLYQYGLKRYEVINNSQRYVFDLTEMIRKMAQLPKFSFTQEVGTTGVSRDSAEYHEFENAVLKRDQYTCQACGAHTGLQVHHIKSYKDYPKMRTDVNNGITLCQKCHIKTFKGSLHDLYGYSPNELDLQEFLDARRVENGLPRKTLAEIIGK